MTVLNFAFTEIRDGEKMQAYVDAAAPIMRKFGAEVVVRGRYLKSLLGDTKEAHIVGVFRFPDMETAQQFYGCDEYLKLVPLREQAGAMTFNFYEE